MRRFLERLLNLLRVRRKDDDVTREIDSHLALLRETYERRGMSPQAARRAARLAFGSVELAKERHRDTRSFHWIEDAWRDAAHGLRLLRRSPVFAATAALSLAFGIGANTAIFTVANALLFRPPSGIASPSELVVIGTARGDGGLNPLPYATYLDVARRTTTLSGVFAEGLFPHVMGLVTSETMNAEPVLGQTVTSNFFTALGAPAARGRVFADGDESAAILQWGYWRRRFNGDDNVIGRTLRINGRPVVIVGIAAPGFEGTGVQSCDVWLAIGRAGAGPVVAGGRLRPGVPVAAAAAELTTIGDAVNRDRGDGADQARRLNALPFSRAGGNRNVVRGFAAVLMVLVSLVLAAACANVASIMLTRATARAREIALRAALGAGRARLARQLLTEALVLFLCSGLLGLGLARLLMAMATRLLPPLPASIVVPFTVDWRVVLFTASLSIAAAVVFGVAPALRGSNVDAGASLKDGVRSSGRTRLRSAFVVGQIACSVLLVVLAASFVRVLRDAGAADPGFDPRGIDIATLNVSTDEEPKIDQAAFWRTTIERVRQLPGVEAASLARVPPGGWEGIGLGGVTPGDQPPTPETFSAAWNIVDTSYFAALRIPLIEGRGFTASDISGAPPVVIVGETLARRLWPGQPPIGRPLRLPPVFSSGDHREQRLATVIGIAADIRSSSLIDGLAEPYVYVPFAQSDALGSDMTAQMSILARRRGEASLSGAMATVVQGVDRRLVLARAESLADAIALGLTPQRVLATISGVLGLVALLLASMGIYGVTAYAVTLRRREFAIRLALGASPARVIRMTLRQTTWLVAAGLCSGLAIAIGAVQILSVFFYGLPATHVPTLIGTVMLFAAIGAAASFVPAKQAVCEGWRRALQEE